MTNEAIPEEGFVSYDNGYGIYICSEDCWEMNFSYAVRYGQSLCKACPEWETPSECEGYITLSRIIEEEK